MKCVRNKVTGGVCRISDDEAKRLMCERTRWEYAGKKDWKSQGRRMATIQQAIDFKPSLMPKKLGKAALPVTIVENAGEMVGEEIAIVKKPKFKKGATSKKKSKKD